MSVSVLAGSLSVDYDAEESPVTDVEERPLSQDEIRKKIIKGVSARVLHFSDYLWLTSYSFFFKVLLIFMEIIFCVLQKESSVRPTATKASKISQQFDGRRRSLDEEQI